MNLNRALIKQQAKQLIKNNVFKLFAVSILVSLCISLPSAIISGIGETYMLFKGIDFAGDIDSRQYYDDADDFFEFYDNQDEDVYDNDFYNFGNPNSGNDYGNSYDYDEMNPEEILDVMQMVFGFWAIMLIGMVAAFLLTPLSVTLSGLFVRFIRGQRFDTDEGVRITFRDSFKKGMYGKKLGVSILRQIVLLLLSYLFFIPGIIFNYSSYFFAQIMCDYPELSPWQAIMLSKKIVKGNRTELFVLELSFIPWMLLSVFVIPLVYVIPYMNTTISLYYENFRLRAIQEGRVTEDDFLSDRQKYEKYVGQQMNGNYGSQGASMNYGAPYGNPQQPMNNGAPYGNPQQPMNSGAPYGNPQQPMNSGAPYGNPQQPMNSGAPYGNPQQPANSGAEYYDPQNSAGGYGQPQTENTAAYYTPPVPNDAPQAAATEESAPTAENAPTADPASEEPFAAPAAESVTAPFAVPETESVDVPETAEPVESETTEPAETDETTEPESEQNSDDKSDVQE